LRRRVLHLVGLAVGAIDKAIELEIERLIRDPDSRSPALAARFATQAGAALAALETALDGDWPDGAGVTQADITTAVGYAFMGVMTPELVPPGRYPRLAAHHDRCADLQAFAETPLERP
jgi:glutathione S-transferase